MKNFIQSLFLFGLMFNISYGVDHPPVSEQASFKDCSDVWGVVGEFCDVQTLTTLAQVSSKVGAEPQLQLRDIKKWQDEGGLLITMFGNPTEEDKKTFRRIPRWNKGFDKFVYEDVLDLLTGFVNLKLAPAELKPLSDKMKEMIRGHTHLTATDREVLGWFMPDKSIKELCVNLGRGTLIGRCQCDARFLESYSAQFDACVCIRRLSDKDLRRITSRILSGADQIESSGAFVDLYKAHIDKKSSSIFWPMKHPNPNLVKLLIKSLRFELDSKKRTGSDVIKCMGLFTFLGCWEEVDKSVQQALDECKTNSEYLAKKTFLTIYTKAFVPVVRIGKVVCWLAMKFGLVKKL